MSTPSSPARKRRPNGYDEALLTDMNGFIAEGPGANMFFEKDGRLFTPALGNILPGITRATVLEICRELSIPVEEGQFTPAQLARADAAFFCGTAAEVIGWESIDGTALPHPWKDTLSRKIQLAYKDLVIEKEHQVEKDTSTGSDITSQQETIQQSNGTKQVQQDSHPGYHTTRRTGHVVRRRPHRRRPRQSTGRHRQHGLRRQHLQHAPQ
jgi:hypothetical protein